MTRYASFSVDFTAGEHMDDEQFTAQGHPATIEITDLWVTIRTDTTETWTPRERIHVVIVGTDSAVIDPDATCGSIYRDEISAPCILKPGHPGQHVDAHGDSWG